MSEFKILIVGGYGAVGRHVSSLLAKTFPGDVIIGGRSATKAKSLAIELGAGVSSLEIDIDAVIDEDKRLNDVGIVVMCIDQKTTGFVEQCIQRGIHYVDISADINFHESLELLHERAKASGSVVALSVGLAPGLTNLMAKYAKSKLNSISFIHFHLLLGLGEKHGRAAIRWALQDLNSQFYISTKGRKRLVKSFEDGKQTKFPKPFGERTTYRANFSDQHTVIRTLSIPSASTRLCFESKTFTWLYMILKKLGFGKVVNLPPIQYFAINLLQRFNFGTDQFILKMDAGENDKTGLALEFSISGNGEAFYTGVVTANLVKRLYQHIDRPGVHHIEQLVEPLALFEILKHYPLKFEEKLSA